MARAASITRRTALAFVLAGCARPSPPTAPLTGVAFEEAHPYIVFPLMIGGKPARALLDNGAPLCEVDKAFAAASGFGMGAPFGGDEFLKALPFAVGNQSLLVEPTLDDLSELALETEQAAVAVAGKDLFREYIVGLNFWSRTLSLYQRDEFEPPRTAVLQPLSMQTRVQPAINLVIDGVATQGIIDLGCTAPILVSQAFARAHNIGKGRATSARLAFIAQGERMVPVLSPVTSAGAVVLAGHTIVDVPISVMPDKAGPFAAYDVVVGVSLLRCFDLILDMPERLWTIPTPRLTQPIERRFTGIQIKPEGAGLRIRYIGPNSPAEAAGLAAGDLITAIDDASPTAKTLREARPGQVLQVKLATGMAKALKAARYY